MAVRDELRDPWGWLVGAVCGGLGWAVLAGSAATGGVALAAGVGIAAAVVGTKVAVGAIKGESAHRTPTAARDRLPKAPHGSRQAELLARSAAAVRRIGDLAGRPADPWIAGEVRSVLAQSETVIVAVDEMSGRITVLDTSIAAARPHALAEEISVLQARMRGATDPDVRRQQQRALTALDAQAQSIDRLLRRRDAGLAQMQASAVGLEGLASRAGELVALGPAALDSEQAHRIVGDLTQSLDSVRAGVDEARSILRDL